MPATEPLLQFVIGGAQKAGTSALAHYLGAHPRIRLPIAKEAHVFDMADFDDRWGVPEVDARYRSAFEPGDGDCVHGDATPFYMFHPKVVARIAAYNPAIRWILLLRDPIERAVSHYHMERARGTESLPFWLALAMESRRLRAHRDDLARGSALRRHSYRARGNYAGQLTVLHRHFPQEQILLLRTDELERDPSGTVARACAFLGLAPPPAARAYDRVFAGDYPRLHAQGWRRRLLRWWWRGEYLAQSRMGLAWPR